MSPPPNLSGSPAAQPRLTVDLKNRGSKLILSDIEPFSRIILGRPLRQYQLEPAHAILDSVLRRRGLTFCVMMSRQAGKNELSAQLEAYLLNLFQIAGGQIVKASPTFKPQTINSFLRLQDRLRNFWNEKQWRPRDGYMVELGAARALFFSAQRTASVVGATASILLEGDEAQDIAIDKWSKDFAPMAASTNATRVLWGTSWNSRTLLAATIVAQRRAELMDGRRRVFRVPWDMVAAEVPAYGEYVRAEMVRLGDNHPLIRTQYKLEEIDDASGLFPKARQALMRGQHPRQRQPSPGHQYALLVDVAGEEEGAMPGGLDRTENARRDATALTVVDVDSATVADPRIARPTYRVVDRRLWIGEKHTRLYATIVSLVEHWQARHIVVDATGVGAGLASFLAARFPPTMLFPVEFTAACKSDIGWGFLAIVETGRYQDYADDSASDTRQFWYEVDACAFETPSPTSLRWGVWESPSYDGLIARGHDDLLISAALCAVLDRQPTGAAASDITPAFDPVATAARRGW